MNHCASLLLLWLLILQVRAASAQPVSLHLTIRNVTTKQPLAYATVYSAKMHTGIYSDESGKIEWTLDASDTITISFLSYETQKIAVQAISTAHDILLKEATYGLKPLEVKASKKRNKTYRIGFYDDPTNFDRWGVAIGSVAANFISNNTQMSGHLKTLLVDLGKASKQAHRAKARVRIYAAANPTKGPGRDILNENIIFIIPRFARTQKIDLTPYNIIFSSEGLFIGIEFLGFDTKEGQKNAWNLQTGANITSTKRDDYKSVGSSWRFPDTNDKPRWINLTDGSKHKAWERTLYKIGAEVEAVE
ncbi:carboxypeptidase-like regulatory domain-containing protein [uncultured Fibrella sp.]|uniref:carboxypeptidase-like regulatory domain-containing protein n=1 Tax=uncultured Fibrella sp. TaxID=1284596 RepID=UPI0035CA4206